MRRSYADHHIIHAVIAKGLMEALANLKIIDICDHPVFMDGVIRAHMIRNLAKFKDV